MKRIFASLLCVALMIASLAAAASAPQDPGTLTVANQTRLSGNFFSDAFGSNSADIDIRSLIHDYPLSAWTGDGGWLVNRGAVLSSAQAPGTSGGVTYTYQLRRDLKYSDGSPITARDYVFAFLLLSSPQLRELGANNTGAAYVLGWDAYANGQSKVFSGLRLLDDYSFSVTVDSSHVPYYYSSALINGNPFPIGVLAPGAQVADDGNGAYIGGDFSAETLRQTLLDPLTGYLSHPQVTSGPYRLTGYDAQAHTATLEINPYYRGNYEGQKPAIKRLAVRAIEGAGIADALRAGSVGLVNKVSDGTVISQALGIRSSAGIGYVSYPRSGAAFLSFAAERPLPSSLAIRQAVAHLIDKQALSSAFLKGHGSPVYGYYGLGQWMARETGSNLRQLDLYPFNIQSAAALLAQDGWMLDEAGQPYDAGQAGSIRYRTGTAGLEPLTLKLAISGDSAAGELLAAMLRDNAAKAGMQVEVSLLSTDALFRQYYRQEVREYDMMFIGSNFTYLFDPFPNVNPGEPYQGALNTTGIGDERLFMLADALRRTPPYNRAKYLDNWMAFQRRWVEVLPMVPLYSNTYYDFFDTALINYKPNEHWNWGSAILYARLTD